MDQFNRRLETQFSNILSKPSVRVIHFIAQARKIIAKFRMSFNFL